MTFLSLRTHVAGVVIAGLLGPGVAAFLLFLVLVVHDWDSGLDPSVAGTLALLAWLPMAALALAASGVVLSLLWPVVRPGTAGGRWVCVAAGVATGILLAPVGSQAQHGASAWQMAAFAFVGGITAGIYCLVLVRAARRRAGPNLVTIFS